MELPAKIGKYEIKEYLGGGMSRVYRAEDTVLGRTVVIKVLTEAAASDPEAKARFLQEARTVGSIVHDHIIRVYDFGFDEDGHPYMVMEFLRGENLRTLIKAGRTGDTTARLKLATDIAGALEHVHSHKIIHRDIKPENIHIDAGGTAKLMDFGIAKTADLTITQPGLTMGTPYYMAPEQVVARHITHLADIYSFGVVLCELMTGVRPVSADTVEQIFYKVLNEPLDLTLLRQSGISPALVRLVERCTAKDPAQRPQSCAEVRAELERILAPEKPAEPQPAKPPVPSRKKWPVTAGAAGVAVLLLVVVAAYFLARPRHMALPPVLETPTGRMVLVPAGTFLAGQDRHSETVPAFYIDQTEVTNRAYERYCVQTGRPLPGRFPKDRPDYPVVDITFPDAHEFARWAGKRLPTMLEWEKAGRGQDGRLYPWGNQPEASRANVAGRELSPAGAYDNGASPYQVRNMAGNAWEFVDQLQTPSAAALERFAQLMKPPPTASEPWYTIRGGSFLEPLAEGALWDWTTVPARYHGVNLGFRCVKDAR